MVIGLGGTEGAIGTALSGDYLTWYNQAKLQKATEQGLAQLSTVFQLMQSSTGFEYAYASAGRNMTENTFQTFFNDEHAKEDMLIVKEKMARGEGTLKTDCAGFIRFVNLLNNKGAISYDSTTARLPSSTQIPAVLTPGSLVASMYDNENETLNRSGHIMMYVYSSGNIAYFLDEMSLKLKNLFTCNWDSSGYFVYNGYSGTYKMGYYEPLT